MKSSLVSNALLLSATACALLAAPAASADIGLAQKKNCMACHAMDKKIVGPSYKDVATKYANDKGAVARLADKIIKGGAGVWGPVPMPANAQVSPAEATQLAQWILTVK
jgi:cytochrome c